MLIVVDVNVIFSALTKKGNPFYIFEHNSLFKEFDFISPEFMTSSRSRLHLYPHQNLSTNYQKHLN